MPGACGDSVAIQRKRKTWARRLHGLKPLNRTVKGVGQPRQRMQSLGRGASVQRTEGGPRLKGSPEMVVAKSAGKSATATRWPAKKGTAQTASDGGMSPMVPHNSQFEPECSASPGESGLWADSALALQKLPSWPVRTSSASIDTGAHNADSRARKLRHAARRVHTESGGRKNGREDTPQLYGPAPPTHENG